MQCHSTRAVLAFLLLMNFGANAEPKPAWSIDLQALGYAEDNKLIVGFCGPLLRIHSGTSNTDLVFDTATRQRISNQQGARELPACHDSLWKEPLLRERGGHIVARWKQMAIEQVCDVESCSEPPGQPAVRDVKYYLKKPNNRSVLLFHDHCLSDSPAFIGDEYILFFSCNSKDVVVNSDGEPVYSLPALAFPYIAVNRGGTRFAVYERDESFFHELEGTTDRVRVKVFQSSNGKKMFEARWHTKGESTRDGRVALSDNGSLLAVIHSGKVLVFTLPAV